MIDKRAKVVEIGLAIRQNGKNVSLQKPLKPVWLAGTSFQLGQSSACVAFWQKEC